MKIYFAGSIRGGRKDQALYAGIIKLLEKFGTVLTEHVGREKVVNEELEKTNEDIFVRDMNWLTQSDAIVAEVTSPSLGVGYEIGIAESLNKRILCVYRLIEDRQLSAMISGNAKLTVNRYKDLASLDDIFKNYFEKDTHNLSE